jgi:hypothetical protein
MIVVMEQRRKSCQLGLSPATPYRFLRRHGWRRILIIKPEIGMRLVLTIVAVFRIILCAQLKSLG